MNNIKISIITITYNSEKTLEDTIKSIREQNYDNLEYIIVDGGSTDSTLDIIDKNKDIISKMVSEKDDGISDAFNKGIKMAEGDIVGIINSDDMLYEDALKKLNDAFEKEIDVYYGHTIICDEEGKPMHILTALEDLSTLKYSFTINHPSVFVKRDAYLKHGLFDKNLFCAMDYDLLLRFYINGAKFKFIDDVFSKYRMGGINMRLRYKTIDEVRDISVRYGANKFHADFLRLKSIVFEQLRPIQKMLKYKNKRCKKL